MKTSALSAMLMAFSFLLSAHTSGGFDLISCRNYSAKSLRGLSPVQRVEHDLVNGIWSNSDKNGFEKTYQFTSEGMAQILNTDQDGSLSYRSIFWRVEAFDNQPFLIFSEQDGHEKIFSLHQTCEGIVLTDLVMENNLALDFQPIRSSTKFNLTKAYLVGQWTNVSIFENTSKRGNSLGAHLSYQFFADGTFTCQFGNQEMEMEENGSWEISKDCQYLLLHVAENNDELENVWGTKVIRIDRVDNHGLILEQVMKTNNINEFFGADNKMYALIK